MFKPIDYQTTVPLLYSAKTLIYTDKGQPDPRKSICYAQPSDIERQEEGLAKGGKQAENLYALLCNGGMTKETWQLGTITEWLDPAVFDNLPLNAFAQQVLEHYPYPKWLWPSLEPWYVTTWPSAVTSAIYTCLLDGTKNTQAFAKNFMAYFKKVANTNTCTVGVSLSAGAQYGGKFNLHEGQSIYKEYYGAEYIGWLSPLSAYQVQKQFWLPQTWWLNRNMSLHPLASFMYDMTDLPKGVVKETKALYDPSTGCVFGGTTPTEKKKATRTKSTTKKTAKVEAIVEVQKEEAPMPTQKPAAQVESVLTADCFAVAPNQELEHEPEPAVVEQAAPVVVEPPKTETKSKKKNQVAPATINKMPAGSVVNESVLSHQQMASNPDRREKAATAQDLYAASEEKSPYDTLLAVEDEIPLMRAQRLLVKLADGDDLVIKAEPGGLFSGWNIYERTAPAVNFTGLSIPADFVCLSLVKPGTPSDPIMKRLEKTLWKGGRDAIAKEKSALEDRYMQTNANGEQVESFKKLTYIVFKVQVDVYETLVKDLLNCGTAKGKVANMAQAAYDSSKMPVSLDGQFISSRFVPKREWFAPAVQEVDPLGLLDLLPEAEAKAVMLTLGRACVGPDGDLLAKSVYAGTDGGKTYWDTQLNQLEHTFRTFSILVGDPGLGKSTMFGDYILPVMRKFGFRVAALSQELGTFSSAGVVDSDLVFLDDLAAKGVEALINSADIKSMVTGGTIAVNEKFEKIRAANPRPAFLALTNQIPPYVWSNADPGVLARFHQLSTRTTRELVGKGFDNRPMFSWEATANKLGCKKETLAAWLLRCSVDYFLETIGYDPETLSQVTESSLEQECNRLRDSYVIQAGLNHVKELTEGVVNLVALAAAACKDITEKDLRMLSDLSFSWELLVPYLSLVTNRDLLEHVKEKPSEKELHVMLALKAVRCPSINFYAQSKSVNAKLEEWGNQVKSKSQAGAFEFLMSQIVARNGFGFPAKESRYAPYWSNAMKDLALNYRELRKAGINSSPLRMNDTLAAVEKVLLDHIKAARSEQLISNL